MCLIIRLFSQNFIKKIEFVFTKLIKFLQFHRSDKGTETFNFEDFTFCYSRVMGLCSLIK
jgi:hypothetical protein